MKSFEKQGGIFFIILAAISISLSSCLTAKKLDKFVATQYNNELPKPAKKRKADIDITSAAATTNATISTTVHKTDKFLPLLFYWQYNHRQSCSLNPSIAATNFSNAVNTMATKGLTEKLSGHKLELTLMQAPAAFSIVAKEQVIWLMYAYSWTKVYIEPDRNDLVVAYKLLDSDKAVKTGTITVKNMDKNKGIRFFQSWKSATSEYLADYNANLSAMTKSFVTQLATEL